jgi:hypothetical protein
MTAGIWMVALIAILRRARCRNHTWLTYAVPLLILVTLAIMNRKIPAILCATIELMIAGYYMLFITAINSRKAVLVALAFTACILSRYYIVFWLPLWFFAGMVGGDRKYTLQVSLFIVGWILLCYIIPFAARDWSIVRIFGPGYELAARGEWAHLNAEHLPCHLYTGNGFAFLFYQAYRATDMYRGYDLLKKLLMTVPLLTVFAMGGWYYFNRHRIPLRIFLMASFKIFLTVFLALILVPYSYLNMVAGFVSIAILAEQSRYTLRTTNE